MFDELISERIYWATVGDGCDAVQDAICWSLKVIIVPIFCMLTFPIYLIGKLK